MVERFPDFGRFPSMYKSCADEFSFLLVNGWVFGSTYLMFWERAKPFSREVVPFTFPPAALEGSVPSTSSPTLGMVFFQFWSFEGRVLLPLSGFVCISLMTHEVKYHLMRLSAVLCLLWQNVRSGICPSFIELFLGWSNALHILDTSPLSDTDFANVSSQSVACLLIFINAFWKFFWILFWSFSFM